MKKNIIYTLVIWLIIFSTLEGAVRTYDYIININAEKNITNTDPASIFIPHPYTAYAANPKNINHNAQGYRSKKNILYKADTNSINIVTLGGSSTYGTRVYLHESYPYLLEENLRKSANTEKNINVINAGLGGYATSNIISLLSGKIIHLKPTIIIFYVGFNDAWTRLMFSDFKTDYTHAQKTWDDFKLPLWRHSKFLDFVASFSGYPTPQPHIHNVAWKPTSGDPSQNLEESSTDVFEANLITLISIARAHGAIPVLVTQAMDFENNPLPDNNSAWSKSMIQHTKALNKVAIKMEVDLIDVREQMKNQKEFFLDVIHMNKNGNTKRAEIIADYLIKNKLIDKTAKIKNIGSLNMIIEYMQLMHADIFVKRVLTYRIGEIRKSGINISKSNEQNILGAFSNFKNIVAVYAQVYKHLSKDTLIEANKFFSSELGKKLTAFYASGNSRQEPSLTQNEKSRLQTYQASSSWKEIQKQRAYINRDVIVISDKFIRQFLEGKIKLPENGMAP